MPRRDAWSAAGRAGRQTRRGRSRLCRTARERSGRRGCTPTFFTEWQSGVRAGEARHGDGFHQVHASAVAAAREVGIHGGGVASAHTEPARGVGPVGAPAPGGNPGREERRGRGAEEEHLPRRADEGAGGAPSARPKLGLHETEEETGNRFILSTIRQKVFDKQAREGLRGRPLWKGFRVLGPARPRPQSVEVQLGRAAHGVAHGGKPSARRVRETGVRKKGESDWRGGARELERRGRTLAPGRGC